ncbi:MAG: hypothetical protein QXG65_03255 [Thermoplasmata archaeon]
MLSAECPVAAVVVSRVYTPDLPTWRAEAPVVLDGQVEYGSILEGLSRSMVRQVQRIVAGAIEARLTVQG